MDFCIDQRFGSDRTGEEKIPSLELLIHLPQNRYNIFNPLKEEDSVELKKTQSGFQLFVKYYSSTEQIVHCMTGAIGWPHMLWNSRQYYTGERMSAEGNAT